MQTATLHIEMKEYDGVKMRSWEEVGAQSVRRR